jgi:hypothetical protein
MVAVEDKQSSLTRCVVVMALGISALTGLRGTGPALAGNVGASWAFALSREGDQDVDVPMLASARSRCCLLEATGWFDGSGQSEPLAKRGAKRGVAVPGAASELP